MASIFKPKGSAKYVIIYTGADGRRHKKTGTTDKGVTERIARDLENKVALRREGLIDPRSDAYAAHEPRPLADHLADFRLPRALHRYPPIRRKSKRANWLSSVRQRI